MKYKLASDNWDKKEINAIKEVIKSNRFTYGPKVTKFENLFAKYFGCKYAIMTNSGSSANLISIASLFFTKKNKLKKGDEVIVPAVSWSTTFNPLQQYGLKLKFVDINLNTLNVDIEKFEKAITKKTKLCVAVSILGNPAHLDKMREICNKKKIIFFEDNCESMGAKINNKYCGTFGDISTHSTFFSHHISTIEGGVIMTNNKEIYELGKSLRSHGWTRDLPKNNLLVNKSKNSFYEAYRFILPGYNLRPTEISAAIGIVQLKKLKKSIDMRRKNAEYFTKIFSDNEMFIIQQENHYSSWFSFTLILKPKYKKLKNKIFNLLKKYSIEFRIITGGSFLRHEVRKYFNYSVFKNINNANYAHDYGFFVGNYPKDLKKEIKYLHSVLSKVKR